MVMEDLVQRMEQEVGPFLLEAGLVLFDCKITLYRDIKKAELLIDKPQGGILLDECAEFNRTISQHLDLDEHWKDFDISVASPGVDFPMRNAKDFKRVTGCLVRVHMKAGVEGPLQYEGQLKDVAGDQIILQIDSDEKKIGVQNIQKGVQLI